MNASDELVTVDRMDAVAHLQLNRPEAANALSYAVLAQLTGAIDRQAGDGARAVVISGVSGRFSAGADLDELRGDATDLAYDEAVAAVGIAASNTPIPVIAAVEKYAFGAGVDIAFSCDAVVLARDARLRVPATRLGLLYNPEALVALQARIGDRAWRRLILLGDELDGETAFALGMGEALAAPGRVVDEALRLAASAIEGDQAAVAATKAFARAVIRGTAADPAWQTRRMELMAAKSRPAAIHDRRTDRRGQ